MVVLGCRGPEGNYFDVKKTSAFVSGRPKVNCKYLSTAPFV